MASLVSSCYCICLRVAARLDDRLQHDYVQLLLGGVVKIDVDDWEASTKYTSDLNAQSEMVWAMSSEDRASLLHFCTGSVLAPAMEFSSLMGYSGQQQRFTIERLGRQDGDWLPTSTCFNTLKLGTPYASAVVLESKLRQAMMGAEGFDEAAVAVH
jgi:hypothetical protein